MFCIVHLARPHAMFILPRAQHLHGFFASFFKKVVVGPLKVWTPFNAMEKGRLPVGGTPLQSLRIPAVNGRV